MALNTRMSGNYLTLPTRDGKRYFSMCETSANFNTSPINYIDRRTNSIFDSAESMIYFEGISISNYGTNAAVNGTVGLQYGLSPAECYHYFGYNLVRAVDSAQWYPLNIVVDKDVFRTETGLNWLQITVTGYAATDDWTTTVWGWIDTTVPPSALQPMSVEGYKWPLTRR